MKESLRRAIARRDFNRANGFASEERQVTIMNMYGTPIHKPVCVRSIRRARRQFTKGWKGLSSFDVNPAMTYKRNSSCRVAREVRVIKRCLRIRDRSKN